MGVPSGTRCVASYLGRWDLVPDGPPITTSAAKLLPVLRNGEPAMLKLSHEEDERLGGVMMEWWVGTARREFWPGMMMKLAKSYAS